MAARPTVVIADYDYGDVAIERGVIEGAGFALTPLQCTSEEELIAGAEGAEAILTQYCHVSARAIAALPRLRHIARYGVGVDIVDVDAATRARVLVTNVPADYCRDEVAEHALALLLYFARKLRSYDEAVHAGTWRWQAGAPIHRLRESRVGIVGLGRIGRAIAERAAAFGGEVVAYDPYISRTDAASIGVELMELDELLMTSDYVLLQAPLTDETHGMFDAESLAKMQPGAVLINTSRGPLIDGHALYDALSKGRLAAAALDDLPEEPAKQRNWRPDNPLLQLPNCLVTPHVAYYSEQSIRYCRTFASEEIVRVLRGESPRSPVNLEQLTAQSPMGMASTHANQGGRP